MPRGVQASARTRNSSIVIRQSTIPLCLCVSVAKGRTKGAGRVAAVTEQVDLGARPVIAVVASAAILHYWEDGKFWTLIRVASIYL
jgi:hypothetical protein